MTVTTDAIIYHPVAADDLNHINNVIRNAVMNWPLAERLKRLSLNVLLYDTTDMENYTGYVAIAEHSIIAVALWDPNHPHSLLHGLYVEPDYQSRGIGKQLIDMVSDDVLSLGRDYFQIKAERVSRGYFEALGFAKVETMDDSQYPYLYEMRLK